MRRSPVDLLFDLHNKSYWLKETRPVILDAKLKMDLQKWLYRSLNHKYYQIMKGLYFEGKTYQESGKIINVTRERVRQVLVRALRALRKPDKVQELDNLIFGDR